MRLNLKNINTISIISLLTLVIFIACEESTNSINPSNDDNNTNTEVYYNFSIESIVGGHITSSDSSNIKSGDTITITAIPDSGYKFGEWSISPSITGFDVSMNPSNIIVDTNYNISATFIKDIIEYTLTTHSENGEIIVTEKDNGSDIKLLNLEPIPNEGFVFLYWIIDSSKIEFKEPNDLTILLVKDYHVEAIFEKESSGANFTNGVKAGIWAGKTNQDLDFTLYVASDGKTVDSIIADANLIGASVISLESKVKINGPFTIDENGIIKDSDNVFVQFTDSSLTGVFNSNYSKSQYFENGITYSDTTYVNGIQQINTKIVYNVTFKLNTAITLNGKWSGYDIIIVSDGGIVSKIKSTELKDTIMLLADPDNDLNEITYKGDSTIHSSGKYFSGWSGDIVRTSRDTAWVIPDTVKTITALFSDLITVAVNCEIETFIDDSQTEPVLKLIAKRKLSAGTYFHHWEGDVLQTLKDTALIRIDTTKTISAICKPKLMEEIESERVRAMTISSDETLLYSSTDNGLNVYNTVTDTLIKNVPGFGSSVKAIDVSPDGTKIINSRYNTEHIYYKDLETGTNIYTIESGYNNSTALYFINDENTFLSFNSSKGLMQLWNVSSLNENDTVLNTSAREITNIKVISVSKIASIVALADSNNSVYIYNVTLDSLVLLPVTITENIKVLDIFKAGTKLFVGVIQSASDGPFGFIINLQNNSIETGTVPDLISYDQLTYSSDNKSYIAYDESDLDLFDSNTGDYIRLFSTSNSFGNVIFASKIHKIYSSHNNGIEVWDASIP